MRGWRRAVGILALASSGNFRSFWLSVVLLRSMGRDVHWTSKEAPYIVTACAALLVCACVAADLKLRRGTKT
jgi:hypothetical protein